MTEPDTKTEDEKIQALFQQNSDQWDDQQQQQQEKPAGVNASPQHPMRSPQQFRNPLMNMAAGFNPMMNMAMLNPHFQFQQMMMQQQLQRQQMTQQRSNTGQSNIPPETQKPPVGYVCFKCGQPGHWIYYCPNVPKGQFVPRPGMNGNQQSKQAAAAEPQKPTELTCRICGKLMSDAVLVPCCGKSFCKECIVTTLNETSKCPVCNKENVAANQVIPNRSLRNTIQAYKEQQEKEAENNEASKQQTGEASSGDSKPQPSEQENHTGNDNDTRPGALASRGGLPIQVFESEERVPRKNKATQDGMVPEPMAAGPFPGNPMLMGGPPGDMSWMMGMPPGMNPAAAAAMMRMQMGGSEQFGFGMGEGMPPEFAPDMDMPMGPGGAGMGRPPFMNPAAGFPGGFGGPEDMFMGGPFPGMPPQDMMGFGGPMNPFAARGGFAGRGRGAMRGGRVYPNQGIRRRSEPSGGETDGSKHPENSTGEGKEQKGVEMAGPDEEIPTGPRADRERYAHMHSSRYRNSSSRNHRSSRSRSRSRSPRRDDYRESRSRRRSRSRSRSRSPSKRDSRKRSASRSPSPSRSKSKSSHHRPGPSEEKQPSSHRDSHTSSSSKSHRSSRHHSSRYRSRERDRDSSRYRSRERDSSRYRSRERDRDRDRHRDRSRDRSGRRDRR